MAMTSRRITRLAFTIVFLLACATYLSYQAFVSSHIEFLRPSVRGAWIVHPNPPIKPVEMTEPFASYDIPTCPSATFTHEFVLTSPPPSVFPIHITAMGGFEASVNTHVLEFLQSSPTWKRGDPFDLGPFLVVGRNRVEITVSGDDNPPALLVEGPSIIQSDRRWKVALDTDPSIANQAARALRDENYPPSKSSLIRQSAIFPVYLIAFLLYCLWLVYVFVVAAFRSPPAQSTDQFHDDRFGRLFWRRHGICVIVGLAVTLVQFHNVVQYDPTRSDFDWRGHRKYLKYVADHWRVPVATDGWEMFQPPLYYFVSAAIYGLFGGSASGTISVKAVQIVSTISGLWILVVTWLMLSALFPSASRQRTLGFSVAAMLPMGFYMNTMINNEIFAAAMIGTAMLIAVWRSFRPVLSWRDGAAIGLICGLAMLSKYTALLVFLSVTIHLTLRSLARHAVSKATVMTVVVALAMCGWYYARNASRFDDPFVGNWDDASGFHYEQEPGYRTLGFYTRFGTVFFDHPERTLWTSFWDGMYASMWTDAHGTFLDTSHSTTQIVASVVLVLALLPSAAILFGFGQAVIWLINREWDHPFLIVALTSVLTFVSVLSFTMEVPFFSTIKATFLLSLIPAIGVFAGMGLETVCRKLGHGRWMVYGNLGLLYSLILYLFTYRGT